MNSDPSNNFMHRRRQNDYYERFHINQFYNAVEDEQQYMNEYASLVHRYNDFITNGNTMFSRLEQTLRENLSRTLVRQSFYYNSQQFPSAASPAPAPAPPAPAPPAPAPPAPAPAPAAPGISNSIPRLLSRYLNNELLRGARQPINQPENTNIFSMLYTAPPEVRQNGTAPTTEQIRRATMNTVFGRITTPVNATCPISRDEFNDDSEVTIIRSCSHIFNRSSLGAWFVNHSTCPMCRSDIREYVPRPATDSAAHLPERRQRPPPPPANLSIDRIDDNEFTFSYDMPVSFNNDQIYQDIVNTVNHITNHRGYNSQRGDDDDDIMEVD